MTSRTAGQQSSMSWLPLRKRTRWPWRRARAAASNQTGWSARRRSVCSAQPCSVRGNSSKELLPSFTQGAS
jgi:hypothetical protein